MSKAIALIPARGGSKRIHGKNIRDLAGHPLIAYTISAALDSGCFEKVLVSSDDTKTLEIAHGYGADCLRRPDAYATDTSPDIEWVRHALETVDWQYDTFSILRPTSPFRKPETIQRAFEIWADGKNYTSMRAIEKCSQHPGKMWSLRPPQIVPVLLQPSEQPWHDSQYASLPEVYVQNASLEIAHMTTVTTYGSISGPKIQGFLTHDDEGLDVNTERDWKLAEYLIDSGDATLPKVREPVRA